MNWINNIIFILVLTCATGSLMTAVWFILYSFLRQKASAKFICNLLRFCLAGYILPFVFLVNKLQNFNLESAHDILFQVTDDIQMLIEIMACIWLLGVCVRSIYDSCLYIKFRLMCRTRMDVTYKYKKILDELKQEVGIKRKVSIYYGYSISVPFVYGTIKPCIYLPADNYKGKELRMILTHELYHIKQGDVIWKPFFLLINSIYWFNPLAWLIVAEMRKWAEAGCDEFCCTYRYDVKEYFQSMLSMVDRTCKHIGKFAPMWSEGEEEFKWRLRCMKRLFNKKITKKGIALVATAVLLCGGMSVYASDYSVGIVYNKLYDATVDENEEDFTESDSQNIDIEYTGTIDDFAGTDVVEISDGGIATASTAKTINWTVKKKTTLTTSAFDVSKGDEIYISVNVSPTDNNVKVGIIQPDYTTRYVYGSGNMVHTFTVTQTGSHKVYITNGNSSKVTVVGYYTR